MSLPMKSRKLTITTCWTRKRVIEPRRQEWGVIETINKLKEGYLSQVIHKLDDLMIENNAIIGDGRFELGFKRGRQKVEKQVYSEV